MLSSVQWQRIQAADISREQAELKLTEVAGNWKDAQKTLSERREALFEGMKAAREGLVEGVLDMKTTNSIFGLEGDYEKSLTAWELLDREKRKQADLAKKLTERVLNLVKEGRESPDLYTEAEAKKRGPEAADAWRRVLLDDVLEVGYAAPFRENGIMAIGDFLDVHGADRLGEFTTKLKINKQAVAYAHARLAAVLEVYKIDDKKVKAFIADAPKTPKLDKLENPKPAKAASDAIPPSEEGDNADEVSGSGLTPWADNGKAGDKSEGKPGFRRLTFAQAKEEGMYTSDAEDPKAKKAAKAKKPKSEKPKSGKKPKPTGLVPVNLK